MAYTLLRQIDTEENTVITPLYVVENASDIIYYTDTYASAGINKYFVVPYNPNVILENGQHLNGEYSEYVSVEILEEVIPQDISEEENTDSQETGTQETTETTAEPTAESTSEPSPTPVP